MSIAYEAMSKARMGLVFSFPFFGRLSMRLELVETPAAGTACTDGEILAFAPAFVMKLTEDERKFLIAHEVMHCALLHPHRIGSRDKDKANAAMDYAINGLLIEAGLTMPKCGLHNKKYDGMPWEEIYALLPDSQKCPAFGQVAPGGSQNQAEIESGWKVAAEAAIQEAIERGDCPASLKREVEKSREAKTPWRQLLWHLLDRAKGADDFSYHAPHKSSAYVGAFMPTMQADQCRPIAVAIDTSGSIGISDLGVFLAEIRAIADTLQPQTLHVCCADAAVASVQEFAPGEDVAITLAGGGGTDFVPAIKWAEGLTPSPSVLIYFTDLMGSFPSKSEIPILWLSTTKHVAPLGTTIHFE